MLRRKKVGGLDGCAASQDPVVVSGTHQRRSFWWWISGYFSRRDTDGSVDGLRDETAMREKGYVQGGLTEDERWKEEKDLAGFSAGATG